MKTKISDLLRGNYDVVSLPSIVADPLVEEDMLVEATLVDMKLECWHMAIGLLFDLRTSLYWDSDKGNTGVLILRGVSHVSLYPSGPTAVTPLHPTKIWMLSGSSIALDNEIIHTKLNSLKGEFLEFSALHAEFVIGMVEGIGEVEGNLVGETKAVSLRLLKEYPGTIPDWDSVITVIKGSHREVPELPNNR